MIQKYNNYEVLIQYYLDCWLLLNYLLLKQDLLLETLSAMTVPNIRQNEIYSENLTFIQELINGSPQLLDLSVFPFELGQVLMQLPSPKLKLVAKELAGATDLYKNPEQLQQLLSELELENVENLANGEGLYQGRLETLTKTIAEEVDGQTELLNQLNNLTFFYRSLGYALYSQLSHQVTLDAALKNFGIITFKIGLLGFINARLGKNLGDYYVRKTFDIAIEWANQNQMTLVHRFGVKGSILIVDRTLEGLTKERNQAIEKSFKDYVGSKIKDLMSEKLEEYNFDFEPMIITGTATIHTAISNLKISKTSTRNKTYFEISKVIGDLCHFLCDARIEKETKKVHLIWLKKGGDSSKFLKNEFHDKIPNAQLPKFLEGNRKNNISFLNYLYQQSIFLNAQIANSTDVELTKYFKERKGEGFIRSGVILAGLQRLRG